MQESILINFKKINTNDAVGSPQLEGWRALYGQIAGFMTLSIEVFIFVV